MDIVTPTSGTYVLRDMSLNTVDQKITRSTSVLNPLGIISLGKLAAPSHELRTTTGPLRGDSGLADAIASLHALGEQHGVTGVSLSSSADLYGGIRTADQAWYESGGRVLDKLGNGNREAGRAIAEQLTAAARAVVEQVR